MAGQKGKMKDAELKKDLDALLEKFGTQGALAEKLNVDQATVSRWLTGKPEPTADGYVRLGIAAEGESRIRFWKRAGLDIDALLAAAAEEAKLPLREQIAIGVGQLPQAIERHEVDEEMGGAFPVGDAFLLEPAADKHDPRPFWDEVVLFHFDKSKLNRGSFLDQRWPSGLYVGRLRCKKDSSPFSAHGLQYVATAGPLDEEMRSYSYGDESFLIGRWKYDKPIGTAQEAAEVERISAERDKVIEKYKALQARFSAVTHTEFKKVPEENKLSQELADLDMKLQRAKALPVDKAREDAERRVRTEIPLLDGVRVLGRVVAWFPARKGNA